MGSFCFDGLMNDCRKYEETSPPSIGDFCDVTNDSYSKKDVAMMESEILKSLNFEVGNPTINTFLRGFIMAGQDNSKYPDRILEYMCNYLAELTLVDYSCVRFLPSVVAASAIFVARFTINPGSHPWSKTLQSETCYNLYELKDCILTIHDLQLSRKRSRSTAIRDKYKQDKFKCVSTLLPPLEIPSLYFEGFWWLFNVCFADVNQ